MNVIESAAQGVLEEMRRREKEYLERKAAGAIEPTPEQIEKTEAYWRSVFAEHTKKTDLMVCRRITQEMDFEEAKKKFWPVLQMRAAHISINENRAFEWEFDADAKDIVRNMVKYFINDATCAWPLSKGLFCYGAPGTGKTELMTAFAKFCEQNELTKAYVFCSLSEIYTKAQANSDFDPVTPNIQFDRCFDELGRHMGPITRYGDKIEVNETLIERRYDRFKRYGQITHFIANATPNDMKEAFAPMVFDRLRAMCTAVYFKGTSKR